MKQTIQMQKIEQKMRASKITAISLLGDDKRNLTEILTIDDAVIQRLGIDHKEISDKLKYLKEKGAAGIGDNVIIDEEFEVSVNLVRGKIPCPFSACGLFRKGIIIVKKIKTGETIQFTDLNIHLIENHGFYEGSGSKYRLDPEKIARFLDLL